MTVASTTIDISQILTPLLQVICTALVAVLIWASERAIAWLNVKMSAAHLEVSASQTAQFDDAIRKSMTFGLGQMHEKIQALGWDHPTVKSSAVALALDYATAHFPGALAAVGIDIKNPTATAAFVTAALNRSFPAVAKTVADSPATPPLNAGAAAPSIINPRSST
jgi:hypothetical protein